MVALVLILVTVYLILNKSVTLYLDVPLYTIEVWVSSIVWILLLLVIIVSMAVVVYMHYYMSGDLTFSCYSALILSFIVSILVLLISSNWVSLVLGWEGLGVSSFFLVNYSQSWESQNNAVTTLMTIRFGDMFLFMTLASVLFGSYSKTVSLINGDLCTLTLTVFCFTKSAIVPFSGWLPKAISAPTPTSALVHSSTLVTAGVVVLIMYSDLSTVSQIQNVILVAGLFTIVSGSLIALVEDNTKKLVAYSTLSQIGLSLLVCGVGLINEGVSMLVAHGLAKSLLFMQIGWLIHTNLGQQVGAKWVASTNTSSCMQVQVLLSLMSLSGVSFLSGILSKEAVLDSVYSIGLKVVLLFTILMSVYLTLVYSAVIFNSLFGSGGTQLGYSQESITIVISTVVNTLLVVCSGVWLGSNYTSPHSFVVYGEVIINLGVLLALLCTLSSIMGYPWWTQHLEGWVVVLSNTQHYQWVQHTLLPVWVVEALSHASINVLTVLIAKISLVSLKINLGMTLHVSFLVYVLVLLFC